MVEIQKPVKNAVIRLGYEYTVRTHNVTRFVSYAQNEPKRI